MTEIQLNPISECMIDYVVDFGHCCDHIGLKTSIFGTMAVV
jgi:hypothetical protein